MSNITISSELREQVRQAREAYLQLANLGTESKTTFLAFSGSAFASMKT